MRGLPAGRVTFLFTDVEASTRMHQRLGADYAPLLERQLALLHAAVLRHDGHVLNTMGDGMFAVFGSADAAVAACVDAQQTLGAEPWPDGSVVRVRMGLHTGDAAPNAADGYTSLAVHQAARICAAAHGGQILASADTAEAVTTVDPEVVLRDLGEFHLRDFDQPVRLLQICGAGLATTFPSVRAVPRAAHNVPTMFTSFVGRDRDLPLLARALAAHRLVTVVGLGGVGKTRFAFEATRRLAVDYDGGAWIVLLATESADTVTAAVASAVGARDTPGRDRVDALVERLGSERLLLVLDNCEHVLDSAAALVTALLAACPDLTVLATSREPLRLPGEHLLRLDPLDLPPDESAPLVKVAASDAVRLFTLRAEAADARFALDETTAPAVVRICRRLDGVPLALELAAARVRHLPVAQVATLLDDRLTILSNRDRPGEARHQTLRAAVEWSHHLLSTPEQAMFRRLAVFRGPFTLDAAEHVCAGGDVDASSVFDLVTSLVDKSLVLLADTGLSLRYRMLVTIGDYAREQLVAAGEIDEVLETHRRYIVTTLEQLSPVSVEGEAPSVYSELADLESDALAAFDHAAGSDPAGAQVIATRLARLHFFRGTHREGLLLVQRALALVGSDRDVLAWLLYREALFHAVMGDAQAARRPITRAVDLAHGSNDPELASCVWHVAGDVAFMTDDFGHARHCYETARMLSHDPELDALLSIRIAELDADGAPSVAVAAAYAAAGEHFRDTGNMFNLARCLTGCGAALLRLSDPDSVGALAEAVTVAAQVHAEADAALAAVLLAAAFVQHGRIGAAAEVLAAVDAWERRHGPAVDAMLVAHADDVQAAVAAARSAVTASVAAATNESVDAVVRRLAPPRTSGAPAPLG